MEERRRLGLVRFSLAMEDMNNWHQMIAELQDADLSQPVCSSDDEDDEEDAEATREVEAANELNVAENQSHRPNF